ncbi:hypothetical protein P3W85_23070 [Cupriavidus basilensis]|uniref:Uncharacterized protein n=1 Tax=Cupriavidus basilensis TaxID=68895 RepID=A0ABT6ATM0_9BURK|nr:hypothetical protein [Cupriavidus basilensis]MDF3835809.1 hypothetical protein [Cupriavidus basilensis]
MNWFVVLSGSHWRNISNVVFQEHSRTAEWSQLVCDGFDASGAMAEIQKNGATIFVPHSAVIVAVNIKDKMHPLGFIDAEDGAG